MTKEEIINQLKIELSMWESDCKSYHKTKDALKEAIEFLEQEPSEDCISRQSVLDGLARIARAKAKSDAQKALMGRVMFFTEQLPSVTPAHKKGKWIVLKDEYGAICEAICSCCEDNGNHRWKYCPNCGAEMDE